VLDAQGQGKSSDLLAALNWILSPADPNKPLGTSNPTNAAKYNIRVVNLSLGTPAVDSYRNDPLCKAVRKLSDAGVVVVAAAGNNGKNSEGQKVYGLIHSPGNEPSAITVGAVNTFGSDGRSDDGIATYSSRGPTRSYYTDASGVRHYDNLIKPDLSAPGNKLIFAEADEGGSTRNFLVRQHPELSAGINDADNRRLMYLSGTSMATPLVAGATALMLEANPKLTPNMVKMILQYTAQPLAGFNTLEQGAGQLNVEGAVRVARLVRTDLPTPTEPGTPLLSTLVPPAPFTSVAGQQFAWAQGILLNHYYVTGTNLVTEYQSIYGSGIAFGDNILIDDGIAFGDGLVFGDQILTSDGTVMGGGTPFLPSASLVSSGFLMSDGIAFGDGILISDGFLMSDSTVSGDSALEAMSAQVGGDDTPSMR
jgi:subtilisin family serine protease